MVTPSMDVLDWLRKQLKEADVDLLREMVSTFVQTLMGAEADALCGAAYGERSRERTNSRNGHRVRAWDTRAGSIDLAIPKLRQGSHPALTTEAQAQRALRVRQQNVQAKLREGRQRKAAQRRTYLLAGIVRCGHCGSPMWGQATANKQGRTSRNRRSLSLAWPFGDSLA